MRGENGADAECQSDAYREHESLDGGAAVLQTNFMNYFFEYTS